MPHRRAARLTCLLPGLLSAFPVLAVAPYDVVILGGQVTDPETGLGAAHCPR